MGRSVSYPRNARVTFTAFEPGTFEGEDGETYIDDSGDDWDAFVDDAKQCASQQWPSMNDDDFWLDREDHGLLSNRWCFFGISEYCGCVAIWLAPKDQDNAGLEAMRDRWMDRAYVELERMFGTMKKVGTFSNGEAVYERT